MQVTIGGQRYTYLSDYSMGNQRWKVQAGAAFTFPVIIGGKACFIKRFVTPPPGYDLLILLKKILVSPLPIVYDVIDTNEHGQRVTYLFLELINGDTLDDIITKRQSFHSRKLTNDLLDCLALIHRNGYWFSDLCEKNIFFDTTAQRYTLIDLDSCEPLKYHPSPIPNTPGFIPGQEFAAAVVDFYRKILKVPNFEFGTLLGSKLNLLQLVPLVAKLELFVKGATAQPNFIYKSSNFPKLQEYIVGKKPAYSQAVFTKVLYNEDTTEMITTLCGFFTSTYGAAFEPQIISFRVKPTQAEVGDKVTFSWEIKNAEHVEIKSSDGSLFQQNLPNTGIYTYVVTKGQRFRLVADTVSQILDVRLIPPPRIASFDATKTQVYFGEKVALSWEIEGRPKQISLTEYNQAGQIIWSDKAISLKGIKAVAPINHSQTYVLDIGTAQQKISIAASPKPIIDYFKTTHYTVTSNESVDLTWSVQNVSSILLYKQPGGKKRTLIGAFDKSQSSLTVTIVETTTYSLIANGISQDVKITVHQPKISFFAASEEIIDSGKSITLSWEVKNTNNGKLVEVDYPNPELTILTNLSKTGTLVISPRKNTSYKLDVGQDVKVIDVIVQKPWTVLTWVKQHWKLATAIFFLPIVAIETMDNWRDITSWIMERVTKKQVNAIDLKGWTPVQVDSLLTNSHKADTPKIVAPKEEAVEQPNNYSSVITKTNPLGSKKESTDSYTHSEPEAKTERVHITPPIINTPEPTQLEPATTAFIPPTPIFIEEPAGEGMKWRKENDLWALYNENGIRVTAAKYNYWGPFKDGKAKVFESSKPVWIDKNGNKLPN